MQELGGKAGQRGEGGMQKRREQRGAPSPGGDGAGGAVRWAGGAMGWEWAWSITRHPRTCLAEVQGWGPARVRAPHDKAN